MRTLLAMWLLLLLASLLVATNSSILPRFDSSLRLASNLDKRWKALRQSKFDKPSTKFSNNEDKSVIGLELDDSLIITTKSGPIQGYSNGHSSIWSSVPFAKPPVGSLRWALPEAPDPWNDTLDTITDPPGCLQNCTLGWFACPTVVSEDCLYLNVFRPDHISSNDSRPVMVFIHGGDYLEGYGGGLLYNGTDLVNRTDVLLVTLNYRLGAAGFYFDEKANLTGNYGYWDQVMAMDWVYDNIAAFGGDPEQITLFGESAGGVSVGTHLMNTSNTYIKAAIQESNPFGIPIRTVKDWGKMGAYFKDEAGCAIFETSKELLDCLRGISSVDLLNTQTKVQVETAVEFHDFMDLFMPWSPTVGTGVLSEQPLHAFQNGRILNIPLISGVNKNEGTLFTYEAFPTPVKFDEFVGLLAVLMGPDNSLKIANHYVVNATNFTDMRPVLADICTDGLFVCPNRNMTASLASNASTPSFTSPAYMYHFNHMGSFVKIAFPNDPACWDKVCHGMELPFVFKPNLSPANTSFEPDEAELAVNMQWYWSMFATKMNPGTGNPEDPLGWSEFGKEQNVMVFDVPASDGGDGMQVDQGYDVQRCDFWDELGYSWLPTP